MPYCPKCGATIDANTQFCPSCGAQITPTPTPAAAQSAPPPAWGPPPPPAPPSGPMQRPTGITILAVLAIIGAVLDFVFAGLVSVFLAVSSGVGIGTPFAFGAGLAAAFTGFLVVLGLIALAVAYGFWTGASWGWWLGLILAILEIISIVSLNVIGFIIGIIIVYYLTRPHVKAWFRKM